MTRNAELAPLLKRLKLGAMLDTLPERIALARREQLDYASFLEIILADEVNRRENRRIETRLHRAGFEKTCRLEDFDWTAGSWTPPSPWSSWTSANTSCWWDRRESARDSWPRPWATPPSAPDTRCASSTPTTSSRP